MSTESTNPATDTGSVLDGASRPCAQVPVHPRQGRLWANVRPAGAETPIPSYPLDDLYDQAALAAIAAGERERWTKEAEAMAAEADRKFAMDGTTALWLRTLVERVCGAAAAPIGREQAGGAIDAALHEAIAAIYFDDSSKFGPALWSVVRILGGASCAKLLEEDPSACYAASAGQGSK